MFTKLSSFQKSVVVVVAIGFLIVLIGNVVSVASMPRIGVPLRYAGLWIALLGLASFAAVRFFVAVQAVASPGRGRRRVPGRGRYRWLRAFAVFLIVMGLIYAVLSGANALVLLGDSRGGAGMLFFFWPLVGSICTGAMMVAMGMLLWMEASMHERIEKIEKRTEKYETRQNDETWQEDESS